MRATAISLLLGAVVAACVAGSALAAAPPAGSTYVAMGSSYAAGTSLPALADDSPPRCGQGTENYPRQVARALKLKLVDRSCGGAVTADILKGGQFGLPAQLDGITADARLVTVTIGGNDVRFTADFGLFSCRNRGEPTCQAPPAGFDVEDAFRRLEPNLREIVTEVRRRAPQARIVFVDYAAIAPPEGTCADLSLKADEAAIMRDRATRLAALTAKVAKETGADVITASSLTRGHDACSAAPWSSGFVPVADRGPGRPTPFHPRLEATTAIAKAIVQRLQQ